MGLKQTNGKGGEHYVYHLVCPATRRVRYIGCTCSPGVRLRAHCGKRDGAMGEWVAWLASQNLRPDMQIVAGPLPRADAYAEELRRIRVAKRDDPRGLFNQNNPGPLPPIDLTAYATIARAARKLGVPRSTLQLAVDSKHIVRGELHGGERLVLLSSAREWAETVYRPGQPGRRPAAAE